MFKNSAHAIINLCYNKHHHQHQHHHQHHNHRLTIYSSNCKTISFNFLKPFLNPKLKYYLIITELIIDQFRNIYLSIFLYIYLTICLSIYLSINYILLIM